MELAPNAAHVDGPLTGFASAYQNSQFVAEQVCPTLPVDQPSAGFLKRSRAEQATQYDDTIGPSGKLNEVAYVTTPDTYLVKQRGLVHPMSEQVQLSANAGLDPREIGTAQVMQDIMLNREIRAADLIMTSTNWATDNTGAITNDWDDYTLGAPVTDMLVGLQKIPFNGDDVVVYGVCSDVVWDAISLHPQVTSLRAGGGQDAGPTAPEELARYLRIQGILVSKVHKVSSTYGLPTVTYSRVWGTTTFAFVVVPRTLVSTRQMAFAVCFAQNLPGSQNGVRVRTWRDEGRGQGGTEMIAVERSDQEKVIQNDAGFLFTSVI